jgi:hypothetical protein
MKIDYYRNTKTIRVITSIGSIAVKLRAHRDQWFEMWNKLDEHPITFDSLKSLLSKRTPSSVLAALKRLSTEHPNIFESGCLQAVFASCDKNPLFKPSRKTRNPSPYFLDQADRWRISVEANRLHACLKQLAEIPECHWPLHIRAMLRSYGMQKADLLTETAIKEAAAAIVSEHNGLTMTGDYPSRFWKTFVTPYRFRLMELPLPGPDDPVLGELFENQHLGVQHCASE